LNYRAEIDGLRAIAVLPVILFHAGFELFSGGFVGVDIFFVISGYLITTILIEDIEKQQFSILNFYERRARRILPLLFFVMLCCMPFAWAWLAPDKMKDFSQSLVAVSLFVSNVLFWSETGYFDTASEEKPLLHTWSLAVEEQYYLLFPVFLILAWRFGKDRVFWTVVLLASLSFLLSEWGWRNQPTANFYLAPSRAWELLSGSIAAFIVQKYGVKNDNTFASMGLIAILYSIFFYDHTIPFPSAFALVPVLGVVLIILFAGQKTIVAKLLSFRPFVGIGLISYSAYLWHQPLFAFARVKLIEEPSLLFMLALSISSLVLALFSWYVIETPFRKRHVFKAQGPLLVASAVGIIIFMVIGTTGHLKNGFINERIDLPVVKNHVTLDEARQLRHLSIRAGICHFNQRGAHKEVDTFLKNWRCYSDDEDLMDTQVLIVGDSHSADKAMALRSVGIDVAQLSGAGCQVAPSFVGIEQHYCLKILAKAKLLANSSDIKVVFLANRFGSEGLSAAYVKAILEYWTDVKATVYIWAPMARYNLQIKQYLNGDNLHFKPSYEREKKFYELLSKVDLPQNVVIIKTSGFWCDELTNLGPGCFVLNEGKLMMTDEDHLSLDGAIRFGYNIKNSHQFKDFFNQQNLNLL
jgi:peptidoglycan/LPS O-acetylase OafA/YrhL